MLLIQCCMVFWASSSEEVLPDWCLGVVCGAKSRHSQGQFILRLLIVNACLLFSSRVKWKVKKLPTLEHKFFFKKVRGLDHQSHTTFHFVQRVGKTVFHMRRKRKKPLSKILVKAPVTWERSIGLAFAWESLHFLAQIRLSSLRPYNDVSLS